ncbi:GlxA family transcriptional regulator [Pacificoceanicola onchidii]|uniref:GlxA family transcriptional regulator n=1 Tax=Pacificoceanicola onchidii TaxID=2562685 RepID=UPI0010A3D0D2|nr:helix-turn-helix domain-containing protein [Pacificoceanicola onchidii]
MTKLDPGSLSATPRTAQSVTRNMLFFLTPSFSPMSVCTAIETLDKANAAGASPEYRWRVVSVSGEPVTSRSGVTLAVDAGLMACSSDTTIIICGGDRIDDPVERDVANWLRKSARHGAQFGALGGGASLLASVGLTQGQKIASHWQTALALQEVHPDTEFTQSVFELSEKVISCPGGAATLDLFLTLVAQQNDDDVAQAAAASLICSNIRDKHNEQTMALSCRFGHLNKHMTMAIERIHSSIEMPLSSGEIASEIGVSTRQLERLFSKHLRMSPKTYINKIRLEYARTLLQQTRLSVMEIALATGFQNTSHFSKLYKNRFAVTPTVERGLSASKNRERC